MSVMSDAFFGGLGKPQEAGPFVFLTKDPVASLMWELNLRELEGGKYLDRFLWMFTPGIDELKACLAEWPFLVPESEDAWLAKSRLYLDDGLALAIKVPLPLDGKMEVGNFQVENLLEYYRTTASPYAKAVAAMK